MAYDRCERCPHHPREVNEKWVKCTCKESKFYDQEVSKDHYCDEYNRR